MAQLPPKAPTAPVPTWPDFPGQAAAWVDEFLDFSSARRGSHRRSMSDSVAFLDGPMADQCRRSSINNDNNDMIVDDKSCCNPGAGAGHDFERFDDDQLMSMFADVGPTLSNDDPSSSPSDHNSINDDDKMMMMMMMTNQQQVQLKSEPDEVQSSCRSDAFLIAAADGLHATSGDISGDKIVDPKRIKRILANRQSAQRSRVRKLQYISELERSVTSLQAEVSVLSPRVAFLDHQRLVLNVDNSVLKQRIAALAQDKVFKDAHQEALKREIERLRKIYYQQNHLKNVDIANGPGPKSPSPAADTNSPSSLEKEQMAAVVK
ncbi:basic leucine zipper 61-like [Andrographis paniculata]|uniref:basic leucine zipper 61-like n=1 Tax=Andrographis paniculata TaxID=175694 RepID=UPI0021E88F98|nr:basic leucine zipper 61-like [Andrographis paniculata]